MLAECSEVAPWCMTFRPTLVRMSETISVRLDGDAQRALAELEARGLSRSEAVRAGLQAAAARLRDRKRLAEEVRALSEDGQDLAEAAAVREMMEELRAPW